MDKSRVYARDVAPIAGVEGEGKRAVEDVGEGAESSRRCG